MAEFRLNLLVENDFLSPVMHEYSTFTTSQSYFYVLIGYIHREKL